MAYKLRVLIALTEDTSLDPSTHIRWLAIACDFSSRASHIFSGLCEYLNTHGVCTPEHAHAHKHTHKTHTHTCIHRLGIVICNYHGHVIPGPQSKSRWNSVNWTPTWSTYIPGQSGFKVTQLCLQNQQTNRTV